MQITIDRDELLKPLSHVASVVERRQTLPILSNILVRSEGGVLELTGTDLEVEIVAKAKAKQADEGALTMPARKLYDICRALPAEAELEIKQEGERAVVRSGRSRFSLLTLPVADFPKVEPGEWDLTFTLPETVLKQLLEHTQFCMAHQDVRYYLNGLLLELDGRQIRAVATDGHRMGISEHQISIAADSGRQVIVPRKGVLEMSRFLNNVPEEAEVRLSNNHVRVSGQDMTLTAKLIDGRFPDYNRVIPSGYQRTLHADRATLREALSRAAILANEKYRGVRFTIQPGNLIITAHNPEQEEAQEAVPIEYDGDELEIGFNVNYVIEAINGLEGDDVELGVNDPSSSCTLKAPAEEHTRYVVMPMRL